MLFFLFFDVLELIVHLVLHLLQLLHRRLCAIVVVLLHRSDHSSLLGLVETVCVLELLVLLLLGKLRGEDLVRPLRGQGEWGRHHLLVALIRLLLLLALYVFLFGDYRLLELEPSILARL